MQGNSTQEVKGKSNVSETAEGLYVAGLKWEFDGQCYTFKNVPEPLCQKLREIFLAWGIGWDGDRKECKGNHTNINVYKRQFARVGLVIK